MTQRRRHAARARLAEVKRVPRVLLPLVWLLAVVWSVVEGLGRGLVRLIDWYVRGANWLGRACADGARPSSIISARWVVLCCGYGVRCCAACGCCGTALAGMYSSSWRAPSGASGGGC